MTSMDLHMIFDFATLKLEIDKSIKTKKTLKNTDQYPKHTQNLPTQHNLILSSGHRPNFDGWSCLTKFCKLWLLIFHNLPV